MKKIGFTFAISIFLLVGCRQPEGKMNVPEQVKSKFSSLYPNAGTTDWEMEDGKYEATFKLDSIETSVLLSADGNVIQTEAEIDVTLLPQPVNDYVSSQPGGKEITSAAKIVDANGKISFEAEVDKIDYLFDENGQFASKEDPEEDENEDEGDQ